MLLFQAKSFYMKNVEKSNHFMQLYKNLTLENSELFDVEWKNKVKSFRLF
jgi:hypothetical protein